MILQLLFTFILCAGLASAQTCRCDRDTHRAERREQRNDYWYWQGYTTLDRAHRKAEREEEREWRREQREQMRREREDRERERTGFDDEISDDDGYRD